MATENAPEEAPHNGGTDADANTFPWHLGVYDAHCHPTDTMSSIHDIPGMKTRCLTVMGTRGQDQSLVTQVASKYGVKSAQPHEWTREECMVPCFGWHPWFAHMMYIADDNEAERTDTGANSSALESKTLRGEDKIRHYQKVLKPQREEFDEEDRRRLSSFPDPMSFSVFLAQMRTHLSSHPLALVGEVGLDRSFRIPEAWDPYSESNRDENLTPGGREGRRLTRYQCTPTHQRAILKKQLQLAAELGRAASVHGVQAHGMLFEAVKELWVGHEKSILSKRELKRRGGDHSSSTSSAAQKQTQGSQHSSSLPYPPRICLHSYSGSASNFKQYLDPTIPVEVFASFSTAINLGNDLNGETPPAFVDTIKAVPDHCVLVESDLHTAGEEMDKRMEDIVRRICGIKEWELEEGVKRLGKNWRRFVFGYGEVEDE
jgi:Tat protein secretion system quality control protein TatD with DNase activity